MFKWKKKKKDKTKDGSKRKKKHKKKKSKKKKDKKSKKDQEPSNEIDHFDEAQFAEPPLDYLDEAQFASMQGGILPQTQPLPEMAKGYSDHPDALKCDCGSKNLITIRCAMCSEMTIECDECGRRVWDCPCDAILQKAFGQTEVHVPSGNEEQKKQRVGGKTGSETTYPTLHAVNARDRSETIKCECGSTKIMRAECAECKQPTMGCRACGLRLWPCGCDCDETEHFENEPAEPPPKCHDTFTSSTAVQCACGCDRLTKVSCYRCGQTTVACMGCPRRLWWCNCDDVRQPTRSSPIRRQYANQFDYPMDTMNKDMRCRKLSHRDEFKRFSQEPCLGLSASFNRMRRLADDISSCRSDASTEYKYRRSAPRGLDSRKKDTPCYACESSNNRNRQYTCNDGPCSRGGSNRDIVKPRETTHGFDNINLDELIEEAQRFKRSKGWI